MVEPAFLLMTNVRASEWAAEVLPKRQVIGRTKSAAISIPEGFSSVSRKHAEVWCDARGIWLRDLGSSCGTHVNGVWLDPHREFQVSIGDRIWLGGAELDLVSHVKVSSDVLDEPKNEGPEGTSLVKWRESGLQVPPPAALQLLTPTELEVLLWVGRGYTDLKVLGKKLFRSPHTVRTHLNSIFRKLEVHSKDELLGWLRRGSRDDSPTVA
jgi:DNA-binding CsgD family transcriptional regulator